MSSGSEEPDLVAQRCAVDRGFRRRLICDRTTLLLFTLEQLLPEEDRVVEEKAKVWVVRRGSAR